MGLFGSYLGALMGGTKKPEVPTLEKLDLATEQQKAAAANIGITPQAQKLAGITADESLALLEKAFPGFGDVSADISKNIASQVKGEIPQDVRDAVIRSGAAKSLVAGTAGSEFSRDLVARDLGLTSLDIMNRGLSSAESWLASSERLLSPAQSVFTGMFVTPGQQSSFDIGQNESQWNVNWLRSQIGAMPDPERLALGEFLGGIGDAAATYFGAGAVASQNTSEKFPSGGFGGGGGGGAINWSDVGNQPTYDPGWSGGGGGEAGTTGGGGGGL